MTEQIIDPIPREELPEHIVQLLMGRSIERPIMRPLSLPITLPQSVFDMLMVHSLREWKLNSIGANFIFERTVRQMAQNPNAIVIAPTYYPETCSILKDIQKLGVKSVIVGGNDKEPLFEGVEQISLPFTSAGVDSETEENTRRIIDTIPTEYLKGKTVYLYQFMHYRWREYLEERIAREKTIDPTFTCTIAADMTQGFEAMFEGKHNLPKVLEASGLEAHIIPNEVTDSKTLNKLIGEKVDYSGMDEHEASLALEATRKELDEKLIRLYETYKGAEGKIVIQLCGDGYQEIGGGEGTKIVNSFEAFKDAFIKMSLTHPEADIKVSQFIQGIEGNFSFITLPQFGDGLTIVPRIVSNLDKSLTEMQQIASGAGITGSTVISARTTLKCVGEPLLTAKSGSGVGNDLGYIHGDEQRQAIATIGNRLGHFMASCGKWGLAGCDIKITPDGKVYIIEINNRQQGPTAQMSEDGESRRLPSLIKMQVVDGFGAPEDIRMLHSLLEGQEAKISREYAEGAGSFYIKFATTKDSFIKEPFIPGFYRAKMIDGNWKIDLQNPIANINQNAALQHNIHNGFTNGDLIIELRAGAPVLGSQVSCGTQVCRIVGLSNSTQGFPSPFEPNAEGTKVVLQKDWRKLVEDFKKQVLSEEQVLTAPKPTVPSIPDSEFETVDLKESPRIAEYTDGSDQERRIVLYNEAQAEMSQNPSRYYQSMLLERETLPSVGIMGQDSQ